MSDRKKRILKLQCLVEELSDRDKQLKLDSKLFEDFFSSFPIPVTMWSLDESGNVLSKRGNNVVLDCGTQLENMFLEDYSKEFKTAHKKAYTGENVSFFSNLPESTYYTRLVPRLGDSAKVVGITGVSWDITSNYKILSLLNQIKEISKTTGDIEKIYDLAEDALNSSRIKGLIKGDNNV